MAVITALLLLAAAASAQVQFGSQPIGSPATQAVNVTVNGGVTVSSVQVLTQGAQGQDFQAEGTFNCSAVACTQSVQFSPMYPGLRLGAVVALDSSNNVLGTTYLSGIGTGGLGILLPGTMGTVAGNGDWISSGDDELAVKSELFLPTAVALDGAGNLYIADGSHNRIRLVCAAAGQAFPGVTCTKAGYIYTVAGTQGVAGYSGDGQQSASTTVAVNTPTGVAIDGAGNVYIADTGNSVIRKISASTGIITTIAGNGTIGYSGDGASATAAELAVPNGVTVDAGGNVVVADTGNNRIRAVCASASPLLGVACSPGNIVTLAGTGATSPLGDGLAATAATLIAPYTVTLDAAGNLYVADSGNNRIRAVCASSSTTVLAVACSAAGVIKTVAGNGNKAYLGDAGPAISAELDAPSGIALDPAGNLYIADTQNFRIRKVSTSGIIKSVAGDGTGNFGGDGGPATSAGIYGPYGLALDGNGNVFVAEYLANRVRELRSNLTIVPFRTPVRQGSTSTTTKVTVENDGTGTLDLTALQAGTNTKIDPAVTTCLASTPLNIVTQCIVGAIFAPASTPALSGNQAETGNIDIIDETVAGTAGSNSPLVIEVTGTATPVNATTVALTSSLNPSPFGQNVTFSAAVTTGSGTGALTGLVNFYNGTTVLQSGVALSASGVATFSTAALPVGLNNITAAYNEDGKDLLHFTSTSDPLAQVVNEVTAVTLSSSANPSAVNASVTFTATISTPAGGGIVPDGTVSFLDGSNTIGVGTVTAGTATFSISTLTDGQHLITAVYNGDTARYIAPSTSAVLKQDVLVASAVAIASSSPSSVYGTSVTFTATVTGSTTVTPTGTVQFLDGTSQIGTGTLAAGIATFATSSLNAGTHSITAKYLGDLNSGPGVSAPIVQTVTQTSTTTTLAATPNPGTAGKALTLTATVKLTAGTGAVTGTVTFTDGATTLGTAKLAADGTASLAKVLGPGLHSIVATYGGDTNDAPSSSSPLAVTVNLATTAVAITSSGSPATVLSSITFTAVVTGNGITPTGTVVFSVDGAAANTATLDGTGKASFSSTSLSVGTHTITAAYSGDTDDTASTSSQLTEVVKPIATATSLGTSATAGTNPQTVLIATVIGVSGPVPTGTVTFMNGTTAIGSAPLDANGVATLIPDLSNATYNIVASYSGDSIHSPSASPAVSVSGTPTGFGLTVNPPTITLASSQNSTVTVTLQSNAGFADTIGFGCGTVPAGVNCHFAPNTVDLKGDGKATVQLTIDTNSPLGGGSTAMKSGSGNAGLSLAGLFLPAGLFLGWIGWRFRKRNAVFFAVVLAVCLSGALAVTGCGGFTQQSATAGTYTLQVTGVGANSNVTHSQNITLTITK